LDNLDLMSASGNKLPAEITGKPARLQLQFIESSRLDEKRAIAHPRGCAHFRVSSRGYHR
jgi:hypothetical protein